MRKKQVNAILYNQTKRKYTLIALSCVIFVVSVIALALFLIYFKRTQKQYVSYEESGKVDYKVYLKNNEFFKDTYLDGNNRYIANLIDYVNAAFNYELSLNEKNVEFKYTYRIQADLKVVEKGTDIPLYTDTKVLLETVEKTSNSDKIIINENIDIDYNYYNYLAKKLISFYSLENTDSTLTINMHINVLGSCEDFYEDNNQDSVITLSIPLTTKTVGIDISNNLKDSENNIIQCKSIYSNNYIFIILGAMVVIIDTILVIFTIKYSIKTRTAENVYEKELKKVLNNYSSYIQMIGNEFDFDDYQVVKVNSFTDMLEISDRITQPILMKENNDKTRCILFHSE